MTALITLELTPTPLERVESDIAVAGFFTNERPLRGGAARADWRLCGGLSKRIENGDLTGESGEALLIGCGRALRTPRLLLLGLGENRGFDALRAGSEMKAALSRCLEMRCDRMALQPLGIAPDDVPRHAPSLLAGLRDACAEADSDLTVQLCVPRSELSGVLRAFTEAVKVARADEIRLDAPELDRSAR